VAAARKSEWNFRNLQQLCPRKDGTLFPARAFPFRVGVSESCMRRFAIPVLIVTLTASPVFAADSASPLSPGKPAGVRQADLLDGQNGMFVVAGAALVGITIALATAGNGPTTPNTNPATSTSGTSP
jgi:hypothetical protein